MTRRALLAGAALLLAGCAAAGGQPPAPALPAGTHWVTAWGSSAIGAAVPDPAALRGWLPAALGGGLLRLRLSNRYGTGPVTLSAVLGGAPLTFGGRPAITVPAGGAAVSDPVRVTAGAGRPVAVRLTADGGERYTMDAAGLAFVTDLEVAAGAGVGAVLVVGSSVANGYRVDGPAWPALLADRVAAARRPEAVLNESISATRLLIDNGVGPSVLAREPALLAQGGVRVLVLADLINDLQQDPQQDDPAAVVAGVELFARRAHAAGVRVLVSTIPPYGGYLRWTPAGEACRQAVNRFLRGTRLVDGVLDLDLALRDPADPLRLRPDLDSGDHLHPDEAGQRAIAAAVPLALL